MSSDVQRGLTAALFEAAAAAMRDEPPEVVLRALGARIRELGLGKPREADAATVRLLAAGAEQGAAVAVAQATLGLERPRSAAELRTERRPDPHREATIAVFEHWRRVTHHEGAKLTADRVQKVRARLREGYSESDLKRAIDGCAASPFHAGENDRQTRYDDLTLICRNGSTVERFRELAGAEGDYVVPEPVEKTAAEHERERQKRQLKKDAQELLKQGKTEEYANALRAIRAL